MGPDEFQMMVNNNAYTNFMAKQTFEYTLDVLESMKRTGSDRYGTLPGGLTSAKKRLSSGDAWRA